ncbi:hypothetical protein BDZ85DRAFT_55379 [Elsinoe ampelina]|uniref:gamma-glutamylcyclotransferase n=1 Tax=Elsinoe ampelina TaxID=302913 RepID=A0A6A6GM41_9PEZI|nr:hypothetical protein BDZ85DRAFT_55379 [Elsinoe ampelina]
MVQASIYFGYGSNLWKQQMRLRCPESKYLGVGRLNGYKWIINDRGYANVVEVSKDDSITIDYSYGLVYCLSPSDETRLDGNEGVPVAYTKEYLEVEFWESHDGKPVDRSEKSEKVKMLVYISRDRTKSDRPKHEYVYRMNQGIRDAVASGVPQAYVDDVLRKYIPDKTDDEVAALAQKQALRFEDEN